MKAMILAAGLGTRLKPLTNSKPKALVSYQGSTLLDRSINFLISQGIDEIIVNLHLGIGLPALQKMNTDYEKNETEKKQ